MPSSFKLFFGLISDFGWLFFSALVHKVNPTWLFIWEICCLRCPLACVCWPGSAAECATITGGLMPRSLVHSLTWFASFEVEVFFKGTEIAVAYGKAQIARWNNIIPCLFFSLTTNALKILQRKSGLRSNRRLEFTREIYRRTFEPCFLWLTGAIGCHLLVWCSWHEHSFGIFYVFLVCYQFTFR